MPIDWKIFTQRPYIKSLAISEQLRLFSIANEKSIKLREQRFTDFANSNSTSHGAAGGEQKSSTSFTNTYSLSLDGVDDRVQLASDFTESGTFTVSFWMKPAAAGSPSGKIYPLGTFPGNSNYVKLDQIGVMWLRLGGANAIFNEAVVGGGSNNLVLNNWQHIAFIRDSSNVIRCYRNGSSFGGTATNSNTLTLNSFGRIITNTFGFEGNLDEIALFQTDETANIATLSTSPTVDLTDLSPTVWLRNGDNGAYKSPQWLIPNNENKDKLSNYSFEFDGVDTSIQITPLDIDTTNDLTLSCWVKSNGFTTWDYLCSNGSTGGTSSLLNLRFSAGGPLYSSRFGGSVDTGLTGFDDGNWHHIAMTINYTNGDVKFYKDGDVSATVLTWGSVGTNARIASIGAINSAGAGSMSGKIDEFAVFQGLQNITDLYNGGEPTTISGAVAYYKMGEEATFSTNWTIPDNVSSNNGTSANMTIEDRVGSAPSSSINAVSFNMDEVDRVEDTP